MKPISKNSTIRELLAARDANLVGVCDGCTHRVEDEDGCVPYYMESELCAASCAETRASEARELLEAFLAAPLLANRTPREALKRVGSAIGSIDGEQVELFQLSKVAAN